MILGFKCIVYELQMQCIEKKLVVHSWIPLTESGPQLDPTSMGLFMVPGRYLLILFPHHHHLIYFRSSSSLDFHLLPNFYPSPSFIFYTTTVPNFYPSPSFIFYTITVDHRAQAQVNFTVYVNFVNGYGGFRKKSKLQASIASTSDFF